MACQREKLGSLGEISNGAGLNNPALHLLSRLVNVDNYSKTRWYLNVFWLYIFINQ
jgi:hypothetical protein